MRKKIFKLLLKGQEEGDFSQSEVRRVTNGLRQIRQMDLNQDEVFERGILYTNFLVGSSIANVYLEVERKEISGLKKKLIILSGDPNSINSEIIIKVWKKMKKTIQVQLKLIYLINQVF